MNNKALNIEFLRSSFSEKEYIDVLGYPSALAKACVDEYNYYLLLKSGKEIFFSKATAINDEWVHLDVSTDCVLSEKNTPPFSRGLDVRISEIVLVCDGEG
jgi:hypothetical protein